MNTNQPDFTHDNKQVRNSRGDVACICPTRIDAQTICEALNQVAMDGLASKRQNAKEGEWVWYHIGHNAYKGRIRSISKDRSKFVIAGGNCNLAVKADAIIAIVEPKDIPIEPPKPVGIFDLVCFAIDKLSRGTK